MPMSEPTACPSCGAVVADGTAGCQALFEELLARDFSDARYFAVHRLQVDTYSVQHPERYCQGRHGMVAHLGGLCSILEAGASPAVGDPAFQRWLSASPQLEHPTPPALRGAVTVVEAHGAADPAAHAAAVRRWAASAWKAYAELQPLAREWVRRAREAPAGRRVPRQRR
jgi:hypothetical protein